MVTMTNELQIQLLEQRVAALERWLGGGLFQRGYMQGLGNSNLDWHFTHLPNAPVAVEQPGEPEPDDSWRTPIHDPNRPKGHR